MPECRTHRQKQEPYLLLECRFDLGKLMLIVLQHQGFATYIPELLYDPTQIEELALLKWKELSLFEVPEQTIHLQN